MTNQAADHRPALDEQAIAELERDLPGGDLGAALETFASELEKRDAEIHGLLAEADFDALASIAHGLKGSAATFCAPALAHVAISLEEKLADRDAGQIDAACRALSSAAVRTARHVREFVARRSGARR